MRILSSARTLFSYYRRAWRQSWARRQTLDAPSRLSHEVQFLPAALALQEQPPHPAPRYILRTLIVFSALALLWACVGDIDVVATASGKVVPSGKSKIIQPSEVAVVKAIHVYDGQAVKAGELLVELDADITRADVERIRSDRLAAQVDSARATALLDAIQNNGTPASLASLLPDATADQQFSAQRWLDSQYQELRSSLDQGNAQIEQKAAEIQASNATVATLQASLPITRQLEVDYKQLLDIGAVGKHAWLEKQATRMDQERELQVQKARVRELQAARHEAERRQNSVLAQSRRSMLDLQHEADQKVAQFTQELKKAEQRNRLTQLTAPVDGTVQQLAIHTDGGVVTEAQQLMVIVPIDQPMEVEAMLENQDIGFVRPGQAVEIKVDTFNFTKYGIIDGTVLSISNDAIEDEKRGLLYSMRIQLKQNSLRVNGQSVALSPGMSVKAEVKTDQRKVIDYFLSPLKEYVSESLGER